MNPVRKLWSTILTAIDQAEVFLAIQNGWAAASVMETVLLASPVAGAKDPSTYEISSEAVLKPEAHPLMLRGEDGPLQRG
ncbi:hypothetical protein [Methylobacterium symbioticum]|uniref:hypothetical protein n=1 Tax=Methylobacterium symbioticum TaxID=2584084 RepID=UPI001156C7B7|nr:hypothetical protein [Methylobacterium symbioticum]